MLKTIYYLYWFIWLAFSHSAYAQTEMTAEQIFESVDNSVVVILAYDKTGTVYQGSGVVLNNDGYIATNYHVIKDADRIDIKHYSKEIKDAEIFLLDEKKDLLILKVDKNLFSPIPIGNPSSLKTGQRVYAIGSPEGYENSISEGIISGFRNDDNNTKLIQMTAPITDGSSGGAVVNGFGELIGLSMSGQHEGNIYFAVPIDDITKLAGNEFSFSKGSNSVVYLSKGNNASESKNYKDADFYYTKHLDKFSNDITAYYSRGYARFKLKEYNKAIEDFSETIESDSSNSNAFFYRGNCYYILRNFSASAGDYTKAIEINPDYPVFYYNRGFAYSKLKMYNEAAKDWQNAIELKPEYSNELKPKIDASLQKVNDKK